MGVGTFESNFLSSITPLGDSTKRISITAIPLGINTSLIGGYLLLSWGVPVFSVYSFVIVAAAYGIYIVQYHLPDPEAAAEAVKRRSEKAQYEIEATHSQYQAQVQVQEVQRQRSQRSLDHLVQSNEQMFVQSEQSREQLLMDVQEGEQIQVLLNGESVDHVGETPMHMAPEECERKHASHS